jgi:GT2 family glycosyltransferase
MFSRKTLENALHTYRFQGKRYFLQKTKRYLLHLLGLIDKNHHHYQYKAPEPVSQKNSFTHFSYCICLRVTAQHNTCQIKQTLLSISKQNLDKVSLSIHCTAEKIPVIRNAVITYGISRYTIEHNLSFFSPQYMSEFNDEYVIFIDAGDELTINCIQEIDTVLRHDDIALVYADNDVINECGAYSMPCFKPDFNPVMLNAYNYINRPYAIRRKVLINCFEYRHIEHMHGILLSYADFKLNTKHIPAILYHHNLFNQLSEKKDTALRKKEIISTLQRRNTPARVQEGKFTEIFNIKYQLLNKPLVTIIIPFKDHPQLLVNCLQSIYEKTNYENFEILCINNNSQESKTKSTLEWLKNQYPIKVINYDQPFNYAKINNFAVEYAQGKQLVLLNNDIEIISKDWIERLLEYSQMEQIGVVGSLLLYPDNTIQHAGVIIGIGGMTGHAFRYLSSNDSGYCFRVHLPQIMTAVTGACMMIKKDLYQSVHGMDETFAVSFNDIDLCLKLHNAGYNNIYTPHSRHYHLESKTRGKPVSRRDKQQHLKEITLFKNRYKQLFEQGDPNYNVNLTLDYEDFSLI